MPNFTFTATVTLQLGSEARPSTAPVSISMTYNEKSMLDFSWASAQTNLAIPQGTVSNPRAVLIEVLEGAIAVTTDIAGAGKIHLRANPTPSPGDPPAFAFLFTHDAQAAQYYVTTTAAARARFTFLE